MKTKGSKKKIYFRVLGHGYVMVWNPTHCEAMQNGYVREHRMIMADFMGRPLNRNEEVHHINGNKEDNRLENLQLLTKEQHTSLTHKGKKRPQHNSKICWHIDCKELTASRYGLCRKHYKAQWQRIKEKKISSFYESARTLERLNMTCNRCGEAMDETYLVRFVSHWDTKELVRFWSCRNSVCPNYALLQVPMEMMPKEKRSEFYGDGYIEVEKPSKVRREKKGVSVLGGEANCRHEWMTVAKELSGKPVSYEQCKKCNGVLCDNGVILVEG